MSASRRFQPTSPAWRTGKQTDRVVVLVCRAANGVRRPTFMSVTSLRKQNGNLMRDGVSRLPMLQVTFRECSRAAVRIVKPVEPRTTAMARVDHLAGGIYRISTYVPAKRISFNQFLIEDEKPALIHTGTFPMYDDVRASVAQVLDPSRLRYIIVPHFEADECGGMGRFVGEATQAVLACSAVGWRVNLQQWDYTGTVQGVQDGDVLDLGQHRLRFWETPHVHHWDSMMVVEDTTSSLPV
jgi:hypothetical protein